MIQLNKPARACALVAALAALAGGASAQVYGGVAGGRAHLNADCSGTDSCNTSHNGYKAYLGYKTDTVFAVEAAYFNFGRYKGVAGSDFLDYDTKGLVVALVMRGAVVPQLPQLRLVGRFGMSMLDTHANGRSGSQILARTDHSNKPYFGVGLEYEVMPQLKVTAAADFTKANYYGETASLRLLSLGAQYDF